MSNPVRVSTPPSPAPPARMRSISVPCGTSSSSTSPARYCRSKRLVRPPDARIAKVAITRANCRRSHSSSSRSPSPMLFAIAVSPVGPARASARIRFEGEPAEMKPPTITLAPSPIPATASSGVSHTSATMPRS